VGAGPATWGKTAMWEFPTSVLLSHSYKVELKLIIWVDINIDSLTDNGRKKQLDAVLLSYNLMAIVHFPIRVQNESNVAVDYIFIDNNKFTKYTVSPI
jgi:hypothetical protein